MLKPCLVGISLLALLVGCSSNCKKCGNEKLMPIGDPMFFNMAYNANQTEIDISKMALTHSQNPKVKAFAQKMIDAHTTAQTKLSQYVNSKNGSLPNQLNDTHQAMVNRLQSLSGPDFDREFLNDQVSAHKATISDFQTEAQCGQDADTRNFARNMIPELKSHLQTATQLRQNTPYVRPSI